MNLYFVEKFSEGDTDAQLEAMRKYFTFTTLDKCDYIYCASIVHMDEALKRQALVDKPLVVYCWDYYLWAHEGRHWDGQDWKKYAEMLKNAKVIVPSTAQQLRLKELLDIDSTVVRSGIYQYDDVPFDGNYILDPLRYYPDDTSRWAVRAAEELNIPIIHSEHQYNHQEFRNLVAGCTFMTTTVEEASTGGLTLAEGLYLGKRSLVSNSPYLGAKDYLGDHAVYFQWDDFNDLKEKMEDMWTNRKTVNAKKWMKELTFDKMAQGLYAACSN